MNILFIHQNFPGQFKHLAPALAARGHRVLAMTLQPVDTRHWQGVTLIPYTVSRGSTPGIHPWVSDFETKVIRAEACFRAALTLKAGALDLILEDFEAEACFRAALTLKAQGFTPDVIIAHPGWGESLFLKDVWPQTRLGLYAEFYYHAQGADVGFDPEFPITDPGEACRLHLKNLNSQLHFAHADAGLSPTHWQASTFPAPFRDRLSVIHDGLDTAALRPNPDVRLTLNGQQSLTRDDEVITFVNRHLEPYRGYHRFMRALPALLRRRPNAHVLIVGGEGVSYGAKPDPRIHSAANWKTVFIAEVRPQIPDADWARVHFLGHLAYPQFIALLQRSRVHVYLTYPFVLSWSLLEAMSCGCAIVAGDTAPVREAIQHDVTGRLVREKRGQDRIDF